MIIDLQGGQFSSNALDETRPREAGIYRGPSTFPTILFRVFCVTRRNQPV